MTIEEALKQLGMFQLPEEELLDWPRVARLWREGE